MPPLGSRKAGDALHQQLSLPVPMSLIHSEQHEQPAPGFQLSQYPPALSPFFPQLKQVPQFTSSSHQFWLTR